MNQTFNQLERDAGIVFMGGGKIYSEKHISIVRIGVEHIRSANSW